MAQRFQEQVNLQPVDTSTGGAQAALSLADRLSDFKTMAMQEAGAQAVARGKASAAKTELVKEDGITQPPEKKSESFFGRIENITHNKALQGAYLASLSNDINDSVSAIETENSADLLKFNDSIAALSKGILSGVDPASRRKVSTFMDSKISAARGRVHKRNQAANKADATAMMQIAANSAADDSQALARAGDLVGSAEMLNEYFTINNAMVEAGLMEPVEAATKRREVEFNATRENLIGTVDRRMQAGDIQGAVDIIKDLRKKIPKGFTTDEHDDVVGGMISSVNESIALNNKIEDTTAETLKALQSTNYVDLFAGITNGTATVQDVLDAGKKQNISGEQTTKLVNVFNSRGRGATDWTLVLDLHEDIRRGVDVTDTVIANAGTNLTETEALQVLDRQREAVKERTDSKHFTNDPNYKQAESFIRRKMRVTGPFGALDTEAESRLADAERELFDSVRAGENPWIIADSLIGLDDFNRAPNPKFGSKDDLTQSLELLNEAIDSRQIDDDTYNFEFRKIERLIELRDTLEAYAKERKAAFNAAR